MSGVPWTAKARSPDILVQPRRDRKAALKLMRKLLKKQGVTPATIVTNKFGSYSSAPDVIAHCRRQLTAYKVPKEVRFLEALPKSNVGKILRKDLRTLP